MLGPSWLDLFIGSFRFTIEFTAILFGTLSGFAIVIGNIYLFIILTRRFIALVWPKPTPSSPVEK